MTHSNTSSILVALTGLAVTVAMVFCLVSFAQASEYAYVDATGEVKSVTASDWMTAIATAFNIHIHSGVFVLKSAADFTVVGTDVMVSN